jgi:hypothetical protein
MSYLEYETAPVDEPCCQVAWDNYHAVGWIEACVMKQQLKEKFPTAEIRVARCPHDFGTYYELRVTESDIAYEIDSNFPEKWTKKSKKILDEKCLEAIGITYSEYMFKKGKTF